MVANRSGVVRSYPPLGMGWWRTDFDGAYGDGPRNYVNYASLLQMSARWGGRAFVGGGDFTGAERGLASSYHTKHALSYDWRWQALEVRMLYFLPREHTLACMTTVANEAAEERTVDLFATHVYATGPQKWWGRDGLVSDFAPGARAAVAKVWAYGDVCAMGSGTPPAAHRGFTTAAEWEAWIRSGGDSSGGGVSVRGRGPLRTTVRYRLTVPARSSTTLLVCLSRGPNESAALGELRTGLDSAVDSLAQQLERDERFWSGAPRLTGAWPAAWKRGWVYDFETLRMTVRPPLGMFTRPWDGMQVHSPRLVLGETALDMQALAYADPALAREVVLGTFLDAPAPNIPCVREDGSVNMVSSDGSECGTAPMWGYPFQTIWSIYRSTLDTQWIAALYPRLAAYVDWWLEYRSDADGWLHCNNSWESGQDGSRRFLVAEGNEAAVADFVRTVDVEASMAQAMRILSELAPVAGQPADRARWIALAARRVENTRSMYVDGWFRDWDARTGRPIILADHVDVMMLAPLACGIATPEQTRGVTPTVLAALRTRPSWLEWPPALQTFAEAAWHGGFRTDAAEEVARIADRVYARTDARDVLSVDTTDIFSYRVPGVANEFWPSNARPPGGENYGWGATLPARIIRTIMGLREDASGRTAGFTVAPALPSRFRTPGTRVGLAGFRYQGRRYDIEYAVGTGDSVEVSVSLDGGPGDRLEVIEVSSGRIAHRPAAGAPAAFTAAPGDIFAVAIR
jgi:hypothetical protein